MAVIYTDKARADGQAAALNRKAAALDGPAAWRFSVREYGRGFSIAVCDETGFFSWLSVKGERMNIEAVAIDGQAVQVRAAGDTVQAVQDGAVLLPVLDGAAVFTGRPGW